MATQRVARMDQGYAWLVAFACFSISFIMAGFARAAGVLYVAIIELYGVSREVATTPFSIRYSVRNMSDPIVGLLVQRYGLRVITLAGGILAGIGGALCSLAPDVFWIAVFWGGVHGIGYGFCNVIHIIILNQYFDKYKGTALGLVLSGDCIGTFAFPSILETLLQNYGVNGTFLILGAIALNVVPAALLMRPPDWLEQQSEKKPSHDLEVTVTTKPGLGGVQNEAFVWDSSPKSTEIINNICLTSRLQIQDSDILRKASFGSNPYANGNYAAEKTVSHKLRSNSHPLFMNSLSKFEYPTRDYAKPKISAMVYNQEICNLSPILHKQGALARDRLIGEKAQINAGTGKLLQAESLTTILPLRNPVIPGITLEEDTGSPVVIKVPSNNVSDGGDVQKSVLLQLLITNTRPLFILIAVTLAVYMLLFLAVITVVIDYSADVGISPDLAKYILIGYSIADLMGRLGFGAVLDKKWIRNDHFAGMTTAVMGLSVLAIPLCTNFYYIMTCMFICGIVQGGNCIMYPLLVEQYMEKKEESVALGCVNFYGGLLMLLLAPMIGFFRDAIGSYNGVFWTTGGLCVLVGISWRFEHCLVRLQQRMARRVDG